MKFIDQLNALILADAEHMNRLACRVDTLLDNGPNQHELSSNEVRRAYASTSSASTDHQSRDFSDWQRELQELMPSELRKLRVELMKRYHPDRWPTEMRDRADQMLMNINAAIDSALSAHLAVNERPQADQGR